MSAIPPEPCPACSTPSPCIVDASAIARPHTYECDEHGMFEAGKLTRKRRVCVKCGHLECPCCTTWCDTLVDDEDDCELCCDGKCTYASA